MRRAAVRFAVRRRIGWGCQHHRSCDRRQCLCGEDAWYLAAVTVTSVPHTTNVAAEPGDASIRPFLKWAGGKRKLVSKVLGLAPRRYERYLEPFVGGGAVAFSVRLPAMLLNDANTELMGAYRVVRDSPDELLAELAEHEVEHDRAYYYRVRAIQPHELASDVSRAARFIYLNRTCFNGLYRVNRKGEFNVPMGRYRNPTIADAATIYAASSALRSAVLTAIDFEDFLRANAKRGDFVYIDPPYVPLGGYSDFNRYTDTQFREQDQVRLRDTFEWLCEIGAHPILSNSYTPTILELYAGHRIVKVQMIRAINKDGASRGAVEEALILPGTV